MNWQKLKSMDCPSCFKPLSKNLLGYICTAACGFQMGKAKFDSVVSSLYKGKRPVAQSEEESLSQLNNLGHEEVSDDFSDRQPDL